VNTLESLSIKTYKTAINNQASKCISGKSSSFKTCKIEFVTGKKEFLFVTFHLIPSIQTKPKTPQRLVTRIEFPVDLIVIPHSASSATSCTLVPAAVRTESVKVDFPAISNSIIVIFSHAKMLEFT